MPESKRILLLTSTTRNLDAYIDATEKIGLTPVVGTEAGSRLPPLVRDHALSLDFSTRDSVLQIIDAIQHSPVAAIIPLDDIATPIASRASSMVGLPWHPPKAADACASAESLRSALQTAGVPTTASTGTQRFSALFSNGRARVFACNEPATTPDKASVALFMRAATALTLRDGPAHACIAEGPAIASMTLAAHHEQSRCLRFRIPLVDEDVSWEEAVIRNAVGLDISRLYLK